MKTSRRILLLFFTIIVSACVNYESENAVIKKSEDAFNYFLSQKKVVYSIPIEFETGQNAPYYQIDKDGNIFMQVISNDGALATENEKVYLRFTTYNLLSYYDTHVWPSPTTSNEEDLNIEDSFVIYKPKVLVPAVLPLEYVGANSEVNLAIRQGDDKSNFPYVIHIQYIPSASSQRFPDCLVNLRFDSNAMWQAYGVPDMMQWQYYNVEKRLPVDFPYLEQSSTGLGGILLVHCFNNYIKAFDAACPVERDKQICLYVDENTLEVICPQCGSLFDVFNNNGIPLSGKAYELLFGMKQYHVIKSGEGYIVTN